MPQLIQAGETTVYRKQVKFRLLASADGAPVTGASVTAWATINGGAGAVAGGAVTEKDATNEPGVYLYVPATAEIASGVEVLTLTFGATGALPVTVEVLVVGDSPYTAGLTESGVASAVRDVFGIASSVADSAPTAAGFVGAAGLSATDLYSGMYVMFTSGTLDGVARPVTAYAGATRTFSFGTPFPGAPANADTFVLIGYNG